MTTVLSAVFAGISAIAAAVALLGLRLARQQVVEARRQADEARRVADIEEERRNQERAPIFTAWVSLTLRENVEYARLNIQVLSTPEPITWIAVEIMRGDFRFALLPVAPDGSWLGLNCWRYERVECKQHMEAGDQANWGLALPLTDEQREHREYRKTRTSNEPPKFSVMISCGTSSNDWPGVFPLVDTSKVTESVEDRLIELYALLESDEDRISPERFEQIYKNPRSDPEKWIQKVLQRTAYCE